MADLAWFGPPGDRLQAIFRPPRNFPARPNRVKISDGCARRFIGCFSVQSGRANLVAFSAGLMATFDHNSMLESACLIERHHPGISALLNPCRAACSLIGKRSSKAPIEAAGTRVDQWLKKAIKKPLKSH